jgi:hypothetical protein
MKSLFDGQDYMLMLEDQEMKKLRQSKLEAQLKELFGGADLGKLVTLELGENDGSDGIKLVYLPEDANGWDEIKQVYIKINAWAYKHIEERKEFGTRYNGSDKITIHDGVPGLFH